MTNKQIVAFRKKWSICEGCFWRDKTCELWSDAFLNSEDADWLKEHGYKFEVIVTQCPILNSGGSSGYCHLSSKQGDRIEATRPAIQFIESLKARLKSNDGNNDR